MKPRREPTLAERAAKLRSEQLRELAAQGDTERAAVQAEVERRITRYANKVRREAGIA